MDVKEYFNTTNYSGKRDLKADYNIKVIGVVGTVGKTTVCQLIYKYLLKLGKKAFLSSTSGFFAYDGSYYEDFGHSTPVYDYQMMYILTEAYSRNCEYLVLEMTAEATVRDIYSKFDIDLVALSTFCYGVCKSFETDEEYFFRKLSILNLPNVKNVVLNISDESNVKFSFSVKARDNMVFFGDTKYVKGFTNYNIKDYKIDKVGNLSVLTNISDNWIHTNLKSSINRFNLLCFLSVIKYFDLYNENVLFDFLKDVTIQGRLNVFELDGRTILIDTGYNGVDGLKPIYEEMQRPKTITVLSTYNFTVKEKEDVEKLRQEKGLFFYENSYELILTKTHRNTNDELNNIRQMEEPIKGRTNLFIVPDRFMALTKAWVDSEKGDMISIIGKGDEVITLSDGNQHTDESLIKLIASVYKDVK